MPMRPVENADLKLLSIFMAVVDAGGLSAAQAELHLGLSSISSAVAALEARLGTTLCRRGRAGFALTADGELVYQEARRLFGAIDQFERRMAAMRQRLSGTLTLGLVDNTISDPNLPLDAVIAAFTRAAPGVSLTLVTRPPNELLRDVAGGTIDLAIGSFPRITLGLTYLPLHVERHAFYCGRGHPLFTLPEAAIDLDVIRSHRIVSRGYWGARDLKPLAAAPTATVNDMEAEARLILSGTYLGYLPEHYARPFVTEGRLRALRPDLLGYEAPFHLARREDVGKAARLFVSLLRDALAQRNDRDG